jgi:transcriptional regulator with XRE-family HTH domain
MPIFVTKKICKNFDECFKYCKKFYEKEEITGIKGQKKGKNMNQPHKFKGKLLEIKRNQMGLSQGELSKEMGFTMGYISQLEIGHTYLAKERIEKYIKAIDLDLSDYNIAKIMDAISFICEPDEIIPRQIMDEYYKEIGKYLFKTDRKWMEENCKPFETKYFSEDIGPEELV